MELKIYNKTGALILTASPNTSSSLTEEVGGECSVSATFTHTAFVLLDVDSYIELEGVRYKVKKQYRPKQKNTQAYEYSVKFYAPIHDAEDVLMLFTEGDITSEFNYDGGPREHLQLWIDNMNRLAGTNVWSIGTVISAENKTIEYKNLKCWDAAFGSNGIAATFETEMWADGFVINLCKASRGEQIQLGYLSGLTNLAQEDNGEIKFFTRLFPLGSTRNIDASKYGYSRLQLPSRAKYVDKNVDLYGVKEEYEESAFSGIYPKYEGTVSSVRTENKTNEEGRDYTVYYFKDSGMNFNPDDYAIPEYTYKLEFQTGELAGRGTEGSFEAAWHNDTKEWEIVNVYPDDTTQIPGGAIIPKSGDKYIPWNFTLPQEYITAAEQAYKQAVDNYLDSYSFDPNKYTGTTDRNFVERNNTPLKIGWNVRLLSEQYFTGGYKDTRITKVVRKLNDLCQATITCTDQVGTTWKTSVNNQLNNLQYILTKQEQQAIIDIIKTTDSKTASDYNVFSALRSLKTLLRKDQSDGTNFLLTIGEFIDSMLAGKGTGIFPNGRIQTDRLEVRSSMIVKELIFNRWFAQEGNVTYSEAGTIEKVDKLSDGTYDLYLRRRWDNDITAFAENDVCFGSINNLLSTGEYYDSWFRVLNVMHAENKLNVVLYPDEEVPGGVNHEPEVSMVITRRGNPVNEERQGFWYLSSYEGCICMLDGVTKPILEEANYSIIIGKLKHLSIFDNLPINYRHSYVYCRGIAIQDLLRVDYQGVIPQQANDRGEWSAEVAASENPYQAAHVVDIGNGQVNLYDAVWHLGCKWMCLITGTTDEPKYGSIGWAMIEGNPAFTIEIDSTNGWYFDYENISVTDEAGQPVVFTTLQVVGTLYNQDVTDDILDTDVSWTRDTGNVSEDNAWAIKRAEAGRQLTLTIADLGTDYMNRTSCKFKATALLRDGKQYEIAENFVTF